MVKVEYSVKVAVGLVDVDVNGVDGFSM